MSLPIAACPHAPAALALVAVALAIAPGPALSRGLPPIVFVSRNPPADSTQIPGLGPHGRLLAPGGRLMIREKGGRLRALLPEGRLWDVSDPAVAPDGERIAFAGTPSPDSAWRLYLVRADGRDLRALTGLGRGTSLSGAPDGPRFARHDDIDPCWIGRHELVFASTRFPLLSEYGDVPATNLYRVRDSGASLVRLTTERNGIEEPAFDPGSGRILASRWWTNRWRASDLEPSGITTDPARALPADSANLWQCVAFDPGRGDPVLAAGDPRARATAMAYQPAPLPGGSIACVYARHLALSPNPGGVGIEIFGGRGAPRFSGLPRTIGPPRRLAGPVVGERPGDPYHDARGLAAPQALSPAALPDGRIVFAYDPGARGDFGVWMIARDGAGLAPLADLPGTLELDPAPLVPWDPGPRAREGDGTVVDVDRSRPRPPERREDLESHDRPTFTFHDLNLFASAVVDAPLPGAPPLAAGLRLRFFAALARPALAGGDTAVLLREVPISPGGEVDARDLPTDAPMFEQVVRADGTVLRSAHGPAHVAGFNSGVGGERRCIGCHVGHSALGAPATLEQARWFNAAPGARLEASSGAGAAAAAVDLKAHGSPGEVAWSAAGRGAEWLRLAWPLAIEVREVVLHGLGRPCDVVALRGGAEVATVRAVRPERSALRVPLGLQRADAIELRFPPAPPGRGAPPAAAIAEVEVIARVP